MPVYMIRIEPGISDTLAIQVWCRASSPLVAAQDVYRAMNSAYEIGEEHITRIIEIEEKEKEPGLPCTVYRQLEVAHGPGGGHTFRPKYR